MAQIPIDDVPRRFPGLTKHAIKVARKRGQIPSYKQGRTILFDEDDIAAWQKTTREPTKEVNDATI